MPDRLPPLHRSEGAADFGLRFLTEADADLVGEYLRDLTFVGEGTGCYRNFDVRSDATEWSYQQREDYWEATGDNDDEGAPAGDHYRPANLGQGFTYRLDGYRVDCCWYWDGDGVLTFVVWRDSECVRSLYNGDCKKDYRWRDDCHDAVIP